MSAAAVVGVDLGTGSARAVAIDREGSVVAVSTAPYPDTAPMPIGEMDPSAWLGGVVTALAGLGVDRPTAICVGGHGPSTVDAAGRLAITFRHPAGYGAGDVAPHAAHAAVLRERFGPGSHPRRMWDYTVGRLGAGDGLQSVWPSQEPLDGYGDPVPAGSPVGTTDGSHGLPEGIVLAAGAHDGLLTAWASAIDRPGRGFDPGGRTGGLGIGVDAETHPELAGAGMPGPVRGLAIAGGPTASHGQILEWWAGVTGRSIPELLEMAAGVEPGAGGVLALPFLEGERAPRWNPALRAELVGLGPESDAAVITRALLESTAYGLGHIAVSMASLGVRLDSVVCSGGPSRSALWTSIKASVLEVPVEVPDCDEMAAYGAALGAGSAAGWWPPPGDGAPGDWPAPATSTVEPEPSEVYRRGLERFIALGDAAVRRLEITELPD